MNEYQIEAQALADEVFAGLGVQSSLLIEQHAESFVDIYKYRMYAHNFFYSGVHSRVVVTLYLDGRKEISFCASGRSRRNHYDEIESTADVPSLMALIPLAISRAKDYNRQEYHQQIEMMRWF